MKPGKLAKRLRRDLAANPKKGLLLGAALLVAGYFWVPLVMGALGRKDVAPEVAASSPVVASDEASVKPTGSQGTTTGVRWERMKQAIDADALMASAQLNPSWRNPFTAPLGRSIASVPVPTEPEPLVETSEPLVPAISPAEAGLVLQSIVVGPRRRLATISGEVYREGEIVPAASGTSEFQLTKVSRFGVELQQNGHTHQLEMTRAKLAQGDEIVPRGKGKDE